jgi:hypothetical protein
MDVTLEVPGDHGQLHFSGGWLGLDDLAALAEAVAETFRRCPDCHDVPASDILVAMAKVAPPDLAAGLRRRAAALRGPSDAEKALAASYERYADQLAEIEALHRGRPGQ